MVTTTANRASSDRPIVVPQVQPWLWRWFTWYSAGYLRQRFHALRLLRDGWPSVDDQWPLIVYMNHPSWYDPLVGLYLARRLFGDRTHYAPIDAVALRRYRFLERLGFFGVDPTTRQGVASFLRTSKALAAESHTAIWITPQGRFTDVRTRPVVFQRGLGHLAQRLPRVAVLPLAVEYTFWNESRPEILVAFGETMYLQRERAAEAPLEQHLTAVQDRLSLAAQRRSPADFDTLLAGRSGVGGVYDVWRRLQAALRGQRFHAGHEEPPP